MQESVQENNTELQFTGNWFIDAGILGFVNLMEEVYGWDLGSNEWKLPIEKAEMEGRFFYAFWYKVISGRTESLLKKDNFKKKDLKEKLNKDVFDIKKYIKTIILSSIKEENTQIAQKVDFKDISAVKEYVLNLNEKTKEKIRSEFKNYEDVLKELSNKKTILENLDSVGFIAYSEFFTNLSFLNVSKNKKGKEKDVLNLFLKLIRHYSVQRDGSDVLDKTMNIFLFSACDFHNIYFGSPPTLKKLEELCEINPVYLLLSIPWSFIWVQKNHFFHTNSLHNSHHIYHRLQTYREKTFDQQELDKLFSATWKVIIDTLFESKADFSLENLYIIEYSTIDPTQQQIQNVEYLSISKLNATILSDDTIRESMNKWLPCDTRRKNASIWILKELLKGKPLFPLVLEHIECFIKERGNKEKKRINSKPIFLSSTTSLYALMIDANKQKLSTRKAHFNSEFFKGYYDLLDDIKKDVSYASYAFNALAMCTDGRNEQDIYELLSAIRGQNRNRYLYVLYRILLQSEDEINKKIVSDYIFKTVIQNENCWVYYGLALLLKTVGR